jgi:hypothetical protein
LNFGVDIPEAPLFKNVEVWGQRWIRIRPRSFHRDDIIRDDFKHEVLPLKSQKLDASTRTRTPGANAEIGR